MRPPADVYKRQLLGLIALGGGLVILQPGDFRIQRLDAPGQRRVLGVKVAISLACFS